MAYSMGLVNAIPVDLIWMGFGVWARDELMWVRSRDNHVRSIDVTVQPARQAARLQPNEFNVVTGK